MGRLGASFVSQAPSLSASLRSTGSQYTLLRGPAPSCLPVSETDGRDRATISSEGQGPQDWTFLIEWGPEKEEGREWREYVFPHLVVSY